MNSPSVNFMMLALWTAVTFLRPRAMAYSKAKRTIRSLAASEIGLSDSAVSSRRGYVVIGFSCARSCLASGEPLANSIPAYRSSVFSRTTTRSIS